MIKKEVMGKESNAFEVPEGEDVQESLTRTCLQPGIHHGLKIEKDFSNQGDRKVKVLSEIVRLVRETWK